ncbi:glycerol-3-phosphate acyltransferase, chloroplastic-like isoform X3 [Durio zibethinus]|uniref:Glycerol-3-phosphate acyltransferase, chloroplastic n=1 Tax=Durio zibethinus TaxID=66656 RepID=A0A6P5Y7X4_DURZI|nr:glycerol-3-phosphate acyltransferase, chloroplastic-like isoform X3 [Durio zibethinus]
MSSFHLPFFTGTSTRSTFSFSIKSSSFPSSFSSSLVPFQRFDRFRSTSRTTTRSFSCVFYSLKAKAMAELVQDKESGAAATGSGGGVRPEVEHSRTFLEARSEQELLSGIRKEVEAGRLPPNVAAGMEELYQNYRNAVFQSGDPAAVGIVLSNMAVAFDRMLLDLRTVIFQDPFVFETYHRALREPFDYYMFGQNYFRPLINFRNSYVGNLSLFYEIEEKLKQGHNVVLISNHQTEADPHIIALLLEKTNPHVAENMIYVAGDRVIADPLCKPFSMGRNLLCVHSKKHMFDVPELAEMKRRVNTRSLKEMALLLRGGSKIVWIAPSGGRDRPDPFTEEWYPVEKEIGEKRIITFHGAGLSIAQKISLPEIAASCEKSEEAKDVYTQALYKSVTEQYDVLKSAVHGKQGLEASTAGQVFSLHKFLTHNKKAIRFVHKRMLCKKNPIFFLMPINDINGRLPFIGAESIRN